MHVRVEAKNEDMPAGTERLLTILENSIGERKGPELIRFKFTSQANDTKKAKIETDSDLDELKDKKFKAKKTAAKPEECVETEFTISAVDKTDNTVTLNENLADSELNRFFEMNRPTK